MRIDIASFARSAGRIMLITDLFAIGHLIAGWALMPGGTNNIGFERIVAGNLIDTGLWMSAILAASGFVLVLIFGERELIKQRVFLVAWLLAFGVFLAPFVFALLGSL